MPIKKQTSAFGYPGAKPGVPSPKRPYVRRALPDPNSARQRSLEARERLAFDLYERLDGKRNSAGSLVVKPLVSLPPVAQELLANGGNSFATTRFEVPPLTPPELDAEIKALERQLHLLTRDLTQKRQLRAAALNA